MEKSFSLRYEISAINSSKSSAGQFMFDSFNPIPKTHETWTSHGIELMSRMMKKKKAKDENEDFFRQIEFVMCAL